MRFTECLNDTTKDRGVLAFAVDPGLVRTSMTELQLRSDAGKTYLPNIQDLFDHGVNIPPSRAAALIADIAAGRFDPLAGRLLRAVDDRGLLELEMEDIIAETHVPYALSLIGQRPQRVFSPLRFAHPVKISQQRHCNSH